MGVYPVLNIWNVFKKRVNQLKCIWMNRLCLRECGCGTGGCFEAQEIEGINWFPLVEMGGRNGI